MTVRIGINGFGPIGRGYLRALLDREASQDTPGIDVVAINDFAPVATLAHLLKYDSTLERDATADEGNATFTAAAAGPRHRDPPPSAHPTASVETPQGAGGPGGIGGSGSGGQGVR